MKDIERQAIRQKRNAGELKLPQAQKAEGLGDRLSQELAAIDQEQNSPTFKDTGREKGLLDWADSVSGAPMRAGIDEMVDPSVAPRDAFDYGPTIMAVINRIRSAMGKDPETQPTGFSVAEKVTDNPYLGTALATGIDLANLPMGVPAEIKGVKYKGKIADATELFQQRGKTPMSPETKLAHWSGEAEVKDVMPKLIDEAEETYKAAKNMGEDMSQLKTIRKSAYDNPDLGPQVGPPKLTHPLTPNDLERFTQRRAKLAEMFKKGTDEQLLDEKIGESLWREKIDLDNVLGQHERIVAEMERIKNPPPKPKDPKDLAQEKLGQFDFDQGTATDLGKALTEAERDAIMQKMGIQGGKKEFNKAVKQGLIRPNVTTDETFQKGAGDFLAQKTRREQAPAPGNFWDDVNDQSFTDDAREKLNSIVARFGQENEGQAIQWLKAAQEGGDHLTYVGIEGAPMPMPNFSAKPTGTIGEPRIQGMAKMSADPFSWIDNKYGAAKQLLQRHRSLGMPATINTSSDLIGRDDYISLIPEGSTVNLYMLGPDDALNRLMYPGNASLKRQEDAAISLSQAGVTVNKIYPTAESYIDNAKKAYNLDVLKQTGATEEQLLGMLKERGMLTEAEKASNLGAVQQRMGKVAKSGKYEIASDDEKVIQPFKMKRKPEQDESVVEKLRAQEQESRDMEWGAKKAKRERGDTERARAIRDEIESTRESNLDYLQGDGADEYGYYMWEGKSRIKDLDNVGDETQELIDWAGQNGIAEKDILKALKEHSSVQPGDMYIPDDNYLASMSLGEQEIRIDGLADKLKKLTDDELEYLNWDQGVKPDEDYIYDDPGITYYLIPDLDAAKDSLMKSIKKQKKKVSPEREAIRSRRMKKETDEE
jgi:DNA repair photolyase